MPLAEGSVVTFDYHGLSPVEIADIYLQVSSTHQSGMRRIDITALAKRRLPIVRAHGSAGILTRRSSRRLLAQYLETLNCSSCRCH